MARRVLKSKLSKNEPAGSWTFRVSDGYDIRAWKLPATKKAVLPLERPRLLGEKGTRNSLEIDGTLLLTFVGAAAAVDTHLLRGVVIGGRPSRQGTHLLRGKRHVDTHLYDYNSDRTGEARGWQAPVGRADRSPTPERK